MIRLTSTVNTIESIREVTRQPGMKRTSVRSPGRLVNRNMPTGRCRRRSRRGAQRRALPWNGLLRWVVSLLLKESSDSPGDARCLP
jgi:hypothetical protein